MSVGCSTLLIDFINDGAGMVCFYDTHTHLFLMTHMTGVLAKRPNGGTTSEDMDVQKRRSTEHLLCIRV